MSNSLSQVHMLVRDLQHSLFNTTNGFLFYAARWENIFFYDKSKHISNVVEWSPKFFTVLHYFSSTSPPPHSSFPLVISLIVSSQHSRRPRYQK